MADTFRDSENEDMFEALTGSPPDSPQSRRKLRTEKSDPFCRQKVRLRLQYEERQKRGYNLSYTCFLEDTLSAIMRIIDLG